jgi:hypothetical protein
MSSEMHAEDCANAYRFLVLGMLPRLGSIEVGCFRLWLRRTLGAVRCGPLSEALARMEAAGEIHRPTKAPMYYPGPGRQDA